MSRSGTCTSDSACEKGPEAGGAALSCSVGAASPLRLPGALGGGCRWVGSSEGDGPGCFLGQWAAAGSCRFQGSRSGPALAACHCLPSPLHQPGGASGAWGQPEAAAGQWVLLHHPFLGHGRYPRGCRRMGLCPARKCKCLLRAWQRLSPTAVGQQRYMGLRKVCFPMWWRGAGVGAPWSQPWEQDQLLSWGWGSGTAEGEPEQALWAPSPPAWVRLCSTPSCYRCSLPARSGSTGACRLPTAPLCLSSPCIHPGAGDLAAS